MKKIITVAYEAGQWKVTADNGEWAKLPTEDMAIRTAQGRASDLPAAERPQIVVIGKDGKKKTL